MFSSVSSCSWFGPLYDIGLELIWEFIALSRESKDSSPVCCQMVVAAERGAGLLGNYPTCQDGYRTNAPFCVVLCR